MSALSWIAAFVVATATLCYGQDSCDGKADLLFLLDGSSSIGPVNFNREKKFVNNVISAFQIDPVHVRIAMVTFNTVPKLGFFFEDHKNKAAVTNAVNSLKFTEGVTFLGEALKFTKEKFKNLFRKGVPKLLILISDGRCNGQLDSAVEAAGVKKDGIHIITIGITNRVNKPLMRKMATGDVVLSLKDENVFKKMFQNQQLRACQRARKIVRKRIRCTKKPADLVFVLDSSTSVGAVNWKLEQQFLVDLVRPFKVGPRHTRVALVTYNTDTRIVFNLDRYASYKAVKQAIYKARFTEGTTFTGRALTAVLTSIEPKMNRPGAAKILFLITDGKSNGFTDPVKVAKKLKDKGVHIFTVGITDEINKKQLTAISSGGESYTVSGFTQLQRLVLKLRQKECDYTETPKPGPRPKKKKIPKAPKPPKPIKPKKPKKPAKIPKVSCRLNKVDMLFVLDASSSVGPRNWKKELDFLIGLTKQFSMSTGQARFGLLTFNTKVRLIINFNEYRTRASLAKAIKAARFTEGVTFMGEALTTVLKRLIPTYRPGVRKLLFMLTDGKANGNVDPVPVAKQIKDQGVTIFSIGITDAVDRGQLRKISSNGCVYHVDKQDDLNRLSPRIDKKICEEVKKPLPKKPVRCTNKPVELVFVLDSSTSVGADNWVIEQKFLVDLVKPFKVGPQNSRVALITYNTDPKLVFNLDTLTSYKAVKKAIKATRFSEGATFTGKALQVVLNSVVPKMNRPGVARILFLVTDGKSNGFTNPVKVAELLKAKGIHIFTVGITQEIDRKQLTKISTRGNVYTVSTFEQLRRLALNLRKKECKYTQNSKPKVPVIVKKPKKPAKLPTRSISCRGRKVDMLFVLDASSSVGPKNWKKELDFLIGLTRLFSMSTGRARFGLLTFNTKVRLIINFKDHRSRRSLASAIRGASFTEGVTFMGEALTTVLEKLIPTYRPGVSKLLFMLTDGKANGNVDPVPVAQRIKDKGVTIFSIGITKAVDKTQLQQISSNGCMYHIDNQKDLNSLAPLVDKKICEVANRK